jgi:hypothetical protein
MPETHRILEAATALSSALRANGVPHAFHGSLFVAVLTNSPQADVSAARPFYPHFLPLTLPPHFAGDFLHRRRRRRTSVSSCQAGPDWQRGSVHHAFSLE